MSVKQKFLLNMIDHELSQVFENTNKLKESIEAIESKIDPDSKDEICVYLNEIKKQIAHVLNGIDEVYTQI